ncbi:hypothetical protein C8R44DRAFT_747397 [Mycena epipterygia]|nr:hypothetical protein C8R44DRAFT_747397 [Mycena epipterygia]
MCMFPFLQAPICVANLCALLLRRVHAYALLTFHADSLKIQLHMPLSECRFTLAAARSREEDMDASGCIESGRVERACPDCCKRNLLLVVNIFTHAGCTVALPNSTGLKCGLERNNQRLNRRTMSRCGVPVGTRGLIPGVALGIQSNSCKNAMLKFNMALRAPLVPLQPTAPMYLHPRP